MSSIYYHTLLLLILREERTDCLFMCLSCSFLSDRRRGKMLRLEVIVLCLLFGALTHSQTPDCTSECYQAGRLLLQCHINMSC